MSGFFAKEVILDDEELSLFDMAYNLRMPVYKLLEEMTYEELLGWYAYFKKRPVGWREDHRTSIGILSTGADIDPKEVFPTLKVIFAVEETTEAISSLKNSAIFAKMITAQSSEDNPFKFELGS